MADNWKFAMSVIVALLGAAMLSVLPEFIFGFISRDIIFFIWFIFCFIVMVKLTQ